MTKTIKNWKKWVSETFFDYQGIDIEHFVNRVEGPRNKTVIHIPARSGSTRVEDKNIKELCGIPLLAYTIAVAKSLPVDRVIVNTDSKEYARIAEMYGAEVPFLRPSALSGDDVAPGLATYYAERFLLSEGYALETVIDMYPTSLFRNVEKIKTYIEKVHTAGHCVTGFMPDLDFKHIYTRRDRVQIDNEQVHGGKDTFFKLTANFVGRKLLSSQKRWFQYELINNPIELIDIDTPEDFALAECIVENDLYDFGVMI